MVLITVALVVVQEMCSRLGVYSGEGLGGLIREQFSVRSTGAALGLLLIANAGLTVSEFAGVGAAMEILGVSKYISVPCAAVAVWALTVLGSYSKAEKLFLLLSLAFLAYPIAAFLGHPNGAQVLSNLVWPHFCQVARVPVSRRGSHRHDDDPLHAVLRGVRRGRQRGQARRLQEGTARHGERRHLERHGQHLHHHRHGGGDRRQRSSAERPTGGGGTEAGGRAGRSTAVRRRAAGRLAAGGLGRAPLDAPMPSPTPSARRGRSRRASGRRRCSTASSPSRSSSVPPSPSPRATWWR